ncbi:MAG: hypothetical protein AAF676_11160 [Pseudomonadota bacterium]
MHKLSVRARHFPQNERAVADFKNNLPERLTEIWLDLPPGIEIELWSQDDARLGQKNKINRR